MADYNELTAVFVEFPKMPTVGSEIEHGERLHAKCFHEASKALWNLAGGTMQELGCGASRCDERDSYDFHGPLTHSRHDIGAGWYATYM